MSTPHTSPLSVAGKLQHTPSSTHIPLYLKDKTSSFQRSPHLTSRNLLSSGINPEVAHSISNLDSQNIIKPCLLVLCVVCKQSTSWFSPLTPRRSSISSHLINHCGQYGTTESINEPHLSTSSLDHSLSDHPPAVPQLSLDSTLQKQEQKSHLINIPETPTDHCPPIWVSGEIHGVCSRCQIAARPTSYSSHEMLGRTSSKLHPVSFFSDITPLSDSSGSSGEVSPSSSSLSINRDADAVEVVDERSPGLHPSPPRSELMMTAKPFRLSFPEAMSMRQNDKPLDSPPLSGAQLEIPNDINVNMKFPGTITLQSPPGHKNRKGVAPVDTTESRDSVETVDESSISNAHLQYHIQANESATGSTLSDMTLASSAELNRSRSRPSRKSSTSPPVADRGATLRTLLRQAKIPPTKRENSAAFHSGHFQNSSDIWEAALVGTPREPRGMEPPSWQTYIHGRSQDRVPNHRQLPSDTSDMSLYNQSTSSHGVNNTAGGVTGGHTNDETTTQMRRPPSRNNIVLPSERTSFDQRFNNQRRPSLPTIISESPACVPSDPDSQPQRALEDLMFRRVTPTTTTTTTPPPSAAAPITTPPIIRQTSSHGLFGRFMGYNRKDIKRRPNTATGSTTPATAVVSTTTNKVMFTHADPPPPPPSTPAVQPSAPATNLDIPSPGITTPHPVTAASRPTPTVPRRPATATTIKRPFTATTPTSPFSASASTTVPLLSRRPATGVTPRKVQPIVPPASSPFILKTDTSQAHDRFAPHQIESQPKLSGRGVRSVPVTPSERKFEGDVPQTIRPEESFSNLPPEDFHSKSRHLTISISPRPSSATFVPGQTLRIFIRKSTKKKFNTIGIVLSGSLTESKNGRTHEFLKVVKPVLGSNGLSGDARFTGNGDDYMVDLIIPEYATCPCSPGPLPLPSAGGNSLGEVSYTIRLLAEKKQLISSQETISVKFHLTAANHRGLGSHLTTRPSTVRSSKGRVVFGAGHLGSIEDYSLSHQIYFFHPERVEIYYAFEVHLGQHSNLPHHLIDQLSRSAKVELNYLMGNDQGMAKGVIDRRAPGWKLIDNGWMIHGSLEVTDLKALKPPISPTESSMSHHSSTSSHSSSSSRYRNKREYEKKEQSLKLQKQLFLIVSIQDPIENGILNGKKLELSCVIGSDVNSTCALRVLGLRSGLGS